MKMAGVVDIEVGAIGAIRPADAPTPLEPWSGADTHVDGVQVAVQIVDCRESRSRDHFLQKIAAREAEVEGSEIAGVIVVAGIEVISIDQQRAVIAPGRVNEEHDVTGGDIRRSPWQGESRPYQGGEISARIVG